SRRRHTRYWRLEFRRVLFRSVLTNTSNAAVSVSQVTVSGTGFSITGLNLPLTLAAGQSSTFNVQFAPTATGSASGSISLVSDARSEERRVGKDGRRSRAAERY